MIELLIRDKHGRLSIIPAAREYARVTAEQHIQRGSIVKGYWYGVNQRHSRNLNTLAKGRNVR